MPDYSLGKIYRITAGNLTYIGSTTEPTLARRLSSHVGNYKRWKDGKHHHMTSYPLIETGQYEITLIELYPCGSKDELHARERFHIESTICVNKQIPGRTHKEWRETNAKMIRETVKVYSQANADTIREYKKTYNQDNAETIRKKSKIYREANRDEINKRQREEREANKDEINKRRREARAKKKSEAIA